MMTSSETYDAIVNAGEAKCCMDYNALKAKSLLAGAFTAIGCMMMLLVKSDSTLGPTVSSILSGLCFSAGLFSVFVCDSELFTGDCLMIFGAGEEKYGLGRMFLTLLAVLCGNIVGVAVMAFIFNASGMQNSLRDGILAVESAKMALGMPELFAKSILCNFMVCLAAWINAKSASVTEKLVASVVPVTVFVALGFEHSVANAFFYLLFPENGFLLVKMLLVCIFGNVTGGMLMFGATQGVASMNRTKNCGLGDEKHVQLDDKCGT